MTPEQPVPTPEEAKVLQQYGQQAMEAIVLASEEMVQVEHHMKQAGDALGSFQMAMQLINSIYKIQALEPTVEPVGQAALPETPKCSDCGGIFHMPHCPRKDIAS